VPRPNKIRPPDAPDHALARLRAAVTVFFALDGFVFAGWVVRIPEVKRQVGADAQELGLALLGVSVGAVLTMVVTGWLCTRLGSRRVTVACGALFSLGVALPPLTHSVVALGLVLVAFGAAYGSLNVAMNSVAVDVVAALRRPVMPSFHAAFSLGGLLGAGLGAVVAGHLSPTRHLLLLTVAGLCTTATAGAALLGTRVPAVSGQAPRPAAAPDGRGGLPHRRLLVCVFGVIALCTAYGEGALADWSTLHMRQDLHAGPGPAAAGYAAFSLSMTAGRTSGTWLLERAGQTAALVLGGTTAAAGMLVASLAPRTGLVVAGFAVTGLGLANIFPVSMARAGALAGPGGIATAATFGYTGMLLGPPAIGFLAQRAGLPTALTTVALLAALAAAIAHAARRSTPELPRGDDRAPRRPEPRRRPAGRGTDPRRP
jgi:MFS family permease